jgi:hypothetical protein
MFVISAMTCWKVQTPDAPGLTETPTILLATVVSNPAAERGAS